MLLRASTRVRTRLSVGLSGRLIQPSSYTSRCIQTKSTTSAGSDTPAGIPPPLTGVKIVDLTRVLAGPLATMLLGDLGADVIKVEHLQGDDTRQYPPFAPLLDQSASSNSSPLPLRAHGLPPESAYFLASNRNKRSITVNLKDPDGLAILYKLVESADILVENYIPGKLDRMGLGWEECRKRNERLIYVSISGYGQTGPYSRSPGYDSIIEAEAGLMSITGERDGRPVKVGVAATDIATGLYTHGAVLAALISREKTGEISQFRIVDLSGLLAKAPQAADAGCRPRPHIMCHAPDTIASRMHLRVSRWRQAVSE